MSSPNIQIKRAYIPASDKDGWRILVDRLWPRGIKKEEANLNDWCKEIAPSSELRKWFNHEVDKWPEFKKKYKQELKNNKVTMASLLETVQRHPLVTLVYGARDEAHNDAIVLKEVLLSILKK